MTDQHRDVHEHVRDRYAAAALQILDGADSTGCGPCPGPGVDEEPMFGAGLYPAAERAGLPVAAIAASLGCGNPLAVADLHEGETVLDLGSGGGIDVLLSARRVGPTGRVYGLDMTEEMLELARANAAKVAATNVEFRRGTIEDIPLSDGSIDVVISNCVISLSPDKPAVFAETYRVLRPGGRIGITDVIADIPADDHLPADECAERIEGVLPMNEYRDLLIDAGFTHVEITPTHQVHEGMHSTIIRAFKPGGPTA